ncbi:hypothetical protein ABZ319_07730 [Nocardia sp. NPDC005978]|uniref:hypothetical protein n=1 Tax=Nocardia sp. NPDC005978 TaxID=3156725 RepID=UPI0033A41B6F
MNMVGSLLAAGVWPLLLLVGSVALVTIVALFRAPREHVWVVFESFAAAFGIHRLHGCGHEDSAKVEAEKDPLAELEPTDEGAASEDAGEGEA